MSRRVLHALGVGAATCAACALIGLCIGAAYELNHSGPEAVVGLLIGTAAGIFAAVFAVLAYLDFH